jgi:isopentenyl-diphosphate delta-isomerase
MTDQTTTRKADHIQIVLEKDVSAKGITPGFEHFILDHCALPDVNLDEIDLSLPLWGKTLQAPLLISSMTGGTSEALKINQNLAKVAQRLGIALGLGSQRAAIENPDLAKTYQVRSLIPDGLLLANLGAVQLNYGYGLDEAKRAVEMMEADALILHLNPLQEAVQPQGDRHWRGLWQKIEQLTQALPVPVIAKEVGNGINAKIARRLVDCGIAAIDVAGAGGTSWSEVEAYRQTNPQARAIAHSFARWGLPTAFCLEAVCQEVGSEVPIFASGGIRDGIDAAKAIVLGATLVGCAAPVLAAATVDEEAVYEKFAILFESLKIAAFCCNAQNLGQLRQTTLYRQGFYREFVPQGSKV